MTTPQLILVVFVAALALSAIGAYIGSRNNNKTFQTIVSNMATKWGFQRCSVCEALSYHPTHPAVCNECVTEAVQTLQHLGATVCWPDKQTPRSYNLPKAQS